MKLIKPIEWATQTNYTADLSGNPWRTGSSPTKVEPLPSAETQGMAPGERYAAQWENYVKNQYGVNDKEARLDQSAAFIPAQAPPVTVYTRNMWDSAAKAWVVYGTTVGVYRDERGQSMANYAITTSLNASVHHRSVNAPNFSISYVVSSTNGSSVRNADVFKISGASRAPAVVGPLAAIDGAAILQWGLGRGAASKDGSTIYVCGNNSTAPLIGEWTTSAQGASYPAGLTQTVAARNGSVVQGTGNNMLMIGANRGDNSLCVLELPSVGGVWSILYDGTNTLNGEIFDAPVWDPEANEWVVIVDSSSVSTADNNASRFRHRVWTGPTLTSLTLRSTYSRNTFALSTWKHIGDGYCVGVARRWVGSTNISAISYSVTNYCVVVSYDYGRTWTDTGLKVNSLGTEEFSSYLPASIKNVTVDSSPDNTSVVVGCVPTTSNAQYYLSRRGGDMVQL